MEATAILGFEQVLESIKQFSHEQIAQLKAELKKIPTKSVKKPKKELTEFQKFLLSGPVMSDEEYNEFLENRKLFEKWRDV